MPSIDVINYPNNPSNNNCLWTESRFGIIILFKNDFYKLLKILEKARLETF